MKATCPVCSGTGRMPAGDSKYKNVISGYNPDSDTFNCSNCGGQYMFGRPSGQVKTRPDGTACTHTYQSSNAGRCLTNYVCVHCGDSYQIVSGD